jgi:hypothetical protein
MMEVIVQDGGEIRNWSDDEYDADEDSMLELTRMMG